MINVSTITQSLQTTLRASATLAAHGFTSNTILRGEYVNMDPDRTPWLGIYRTKVGYDPRALGRGNNCAWQGTVTIRLLIQASHLQGGDDCEDRLEGYIKDVLDAVWADPTWVDVVDMVTGIDVEYSYKERDTATIYFQWAMVTITAEVATG